MLCFLISIPATFGIFLVSDQLLEILFVRGEFSLNDARLTGMSLRALCLGLPAFILIKVLSVIFFSREDTKRPVKIGFIALFANLFFNLLLIDEYKHVGLAFATSISAWLNVTILYFILRKRGVIELKKNTIEILFKSLLSSVLMYFLLNEAIHKYLIADSFLAKFSLLGIIIMFGVILYLFFLYLLRTSYLKIKR